MALTLACKDCKWPTSESLLSLETAEVCSLDLAVICLRLIINITTEIQLPGTRIFLYDWQRVKNSFSLSESTWIYLDPKGSRSRSHLGQTGFGSPCFLKDCNISHVCRRMGGESSKAMSIAFESCREVKVLSGNITGLRVRGPRF